MPLLILGLALWIGVHFIPTLAPGLKKALISRLGENGYKGIFSLAMIGAILLIVFGWRSSLPQQLYFLGVGVRHLAVLLIPVSIYLFVLAKSNGRVKRWIRHPQLSGVTLWAIAHLLLNGDNRSLILFAALGCWAILEMLLINRREGIWIKTAAPTMGVEAINLLIALVVSGLLVYVHPYIAGVPVSI